MKRETLPIRQAMKDLKLPSTGSYNCNYAERGETYYWDRYGGFSGDKTVYNVLKKADELGWSGDVKHYSNVTGESVSNLGDRLSPDGKIILSTYCRYGATTMDNRYSITLKFV